jgi:hypothetical protein
LLVSFAAAAAEPIDLTVDEFKMFRHYQNALEDPRVQKMKPERRMAAIADDAGFKLKDLQRAVKRGEAAGDVKAKCEANLREEIGQGELAGRVDKIEVDAREPHAVAYVEWANENPSNLEEEACLVALKAAEACPIVSTIQVWAQDRANPTARVFQALIARDAAVRIRPERVKDFAKTRYIRLFEKVKSINAGDDLSAPLGPEKATR